MTKRAVLIGINQYEDPSIEDLSGCVNDVEAVAGVLVESYEFDVNDVTKLTAPGSNTRRGILDALTLLVDSTEHGDVAVVYYSGHGSQIADADADEADGWDETIVPSDSSRQDPSKVLDIVDDELHSYMFALAERTPYATFIFDSCHSGSIDRDLIRPGTVRALREDSRPVPRAILPTRDPLAVPEELYPSVDPSTGGEMSASGLILQGNYLLIAGCRDDEVSMEEQFGAEAHGLLTHYLVEGLRADSASSMEALVAKVRVEVEQEAKRRDKHQRPVFEGPARLRGERPFGAADGVPKGSTGNPAADPQGSHGSQGKPATPTPTTTTTVPTATPTATTTVPTPTPTPTTTTTSEENNDDEEDGGPKILQWDTKFAAASAGGVIAILVLIGLAFVVLTGSALDGQDGATKVTTTFVVELLFAGLILGGAGAYIALLDQRGRSNAVENVLTATAGPKARGDGSTIGVDQVKGVFEALGKMPTARGLIAVGGLVIVGAIALAWHSLPESATGQAPAITGQPHAVQSRPGGKAQFSISVRGSGLSYEWLRNGKRIGGAGELPTLAIQSVKKAEDGDLFSAVVINEYGKATSDAAKLTVKQ